MVGVVVAEDADAVLAGGVELLERDLLDLEQLAQALAEALLALGVVGEPGEQAVGGEDGEAGVVERSAPSACSGARPRRRPPRVRRGRSRSGGGRRRSAARRRRARCGDRLVDRRVGDPPDPVDGAVVVGDLAPGRRRRSPARPAARRRRWRARRSARGCGGWRGSGRGGPASGRAGCARGGARGRARSPRPATRARIAVAGVLGAVGRRVVLGQRPERGLAVLGEDALGASTPRSSRRRARRGRRRRPVCGRSISTTLKGERPSSSRPLLGVDHVVGRRGDVAQRADAVEVVVQGGEGADVGHGRRNLPGQSVRPGGNGP